MHQILKLMGIGGDHIIRQLTHMNLGHETIHIDQHGSIESILYMVVDTSQKGSLSYLRGNMDWELGYVSEQSEPSEVEPPFGPLGPNLHH
jgi:hypothetical protein